MRKIKSSYGQKLVIPKIEVRRSSTLQFPVGAGVDETKLGGTLSASASSFSLYTPEPSRPSSMTRTMLKYRCCFGVCRLRVGACSVGAACIGVSILAMCVLLSVSGTFSRDMQTSLTLPLAGAVLFQTATAMLLIIGVLVDTSQLLVPFLANCIIVMVGAIIITILSLAWLPSARKHSPIVLISVSILFCMYAWFLSVTGMTYVLIRQSRRFDMGEIRSIAGSGSFV